MFVKCWVGGITMRFVSLFVMLLALGELVRGHDTSVEFKEVQDAQKTLVAKLLELKKENESLKKEVSKLGTELKGARRRLLSWDFPRPTD